MQRPLVVVAGVLACSALAACSLLVSTDGLSGGATGTGEAGAGEGGVDGAADGAPSEGGADAATDAPPPPFCATRPGSLFCDDFDDAQPFSNRWTEVGDGVSRDPLSLTKPSALRTTLATTGNCQYAQLGRRYETTKAKLAARFAVRLGDASGAFPNGHFYGYLRVGHPTKSCLLLLGQLDGSTRIMVQGKDDAGQQFDDFLDLTKSMEPGRWYVQRIEVDRSSAAPTVRAFLDDVEVLTPTAIPKCAWDGSGHLYLGQHCSAKPGEVRFDDVELREP